MDIHVFAFAFIAVAYTLVVLVTGNPLAFLWGRYWRRPQVTHKSTQLGQSQFALKEGQTLVGVIDTTKVICFYIDQNMRDEKPYE